MLTYLGKARVRMHGDDVECLKVKHTYDFTKSEICLIPINQGGIVLHPKHPSSVTADGEHQYCFSPACEGFKDAIGKRVNFSKSATKQGALRHQ